MDQHRIELALMPPSSPFRAEIEQAANSLGVALVPVDAATPADLAERVLVVDLSVTC